MIARVSSHQSALLILGIQATCVTLAVGFRGWLQYRRTKDFGFRSPFKRNQVFGWLGGVVFLVSSVLAVVAELARWIAPRTIPMTFVVFGIILAVCGMSVTTISQLQMRDSWRIGVDEREVTKLVTSGIFAYVRNPIFSGLLLVSAGILLILPSVFSALALVSAVLLVEYQVRYNEEPYLKRVHGHAYASYGSAVGRFIPRVGCFR